MTSHHPDLSNELRVHRRVSSLDKRRMTINVLPNDVLLHIFHFDQGTWHLSRRWVRLVHVCRRWRSVVLASSNFLGLRLVCGPKTRVELIGIWPPLPIILTNFIDWPMPEDYDFDAAIVHHSRVCQINLRLTSSQLQRLASAMQEQFPSLTHLKLRFDRNDKRPLAVSALSEGFLGGSAPSLQFVVLDRIPYLSLPKLLLSATHLVRIALRNIPHSGYISPEAFVTGLAMLANLKSLTIGFESPLSRPDRRNQRPPPITRTVLPALTHFVFKGVSEYLEVFAARIDAPILESIQITFLHQLIFHIPQLAQFMGRATSFEAPKELHVVFDYYEVLVESLPPIRGIKNIAEQSKHRETSGFDESVLRISCRKLDWQLSSLAQVCTSSIPFIYMVEHLYIYEPRYLLSQWQDDIENIQWPELFLPFTAVKNLYVCKEFAPSISLALQELVGERVTGVLPVLESIFLEELQASGPIREAIGQFVAARQLLGHPIAITHWNLTREAILPRF